MMKRRHVVTTLFVIVFAAVPFCRADETLDTISIVSALIDVTKDADAEVRYAAFEVLRRQPASPELVDLYWQAFDEKDIKIQRLALDQVVAWEGASERVLTRLLSLLDIKGGSPQGQSLAQAAKRHLVVAGEPAVPYLIEALKRDEWNLLVVETLGEIPLGEFRGTVVPQLSALLKSENKYVKLAAVRSLDQIMRADAKRNADDQVQAASRSSGVDARYLAYYQKLLEKYDSSGDGWLTADEWSKMSKDPAEADTDKDGQITILELAKWSIKKP